jgi:hypothetical protein
MRRVIIVLALSVVMLMSMAGAALAGNGYGRAVQDEACFGTTYGQAKNAAWDAGHAEKPAAGAKLAAIVHGCVG